MGIVKKHGKLHAQRGISLIEVLSVVALLGIITGIAVTNLKGMGSSFRVRSAALMVAGDMAQARLGAIKTHNRYYFVPMGGSRYQIQRDDVAQPGGTEVVKDVTVSVEYPGVVFAATGIANGPYGGAVAGPVPGTITFNSNGTAANPGSLFLEPGDEHQGRQHVVSVTGAGRIRAWHYVSGSWD